MTTCKYCGSVLPDGAGFCGQCGRGTGEIANIPVNNNAVTVFSRSSSYNSDPDAPTRPLIADPEAPTRPLTSDVDLPPYTKQTKQSTPNNFPLLSAGAVAGGQIVPGGAPVVSGTPQVGGAASVSGTPDLSGLTEEVPHADHLQPQMLHGEHRQPDIFHGEHQQPEMFHGEHQQPQLFHGEGQQPQLLHGERQQLLHADHQQPQLFHADHQQPQLLHGEHQQPQLFHADHQQPQLAYAAHVRPGVVQDHAAHQLPQVVHADHQQPQVSRISYGGKASRAVRPSFLTTVVSVAVVVATVTAVLFVLYLNKTSSSAAPPPAVAINGSAIPGQAVIMRGSNFVAGSTVTVTLDNQSLGASNGPTTMSMLQLLGQQTPLSGTPVKVSSDGTFSLTIHIDPNWSISSTHTVRVYDQSGAFVLSKDIVVISDTTPRVADCTSSTSVKKVNIGPITEGQSQTVSAPFTLCTQGKGSVNWTSNWDQNQAPWLQIDHTSGQAQAPQMQQLTLSAFSVNLNAGTYTTTVTFSGGNAEVSLEVTLVVQAKPTPTLQPPTPTPVPLPCIKANTQALTFASQEGQGDPAAQNVTITNCGPTGNWSATTTTQSGGNWLSSSATTGSLGAGAAQNVAIKVSNANMVAGTYKGIVTLSIGTQTVTVNVTLNVSVKPICVQPATGTLSFNSAHGATPGAQSLALNNPCGAGNWSATADANWITINPANGSIAAKGSANVSIGTTIDTLGAGSHTGTITFTSGTTTAKVSVTLTIQPPATCITLSDSTLSFSEQATSEGGTDSKSVTINNPSPCDAGDWSANSDAKWLSPNPSSGQIAGNNGTVTVTINVNFNGLSANTYTGHITFTSGSTTKTLTVTLTIQAPPTPPCITVDQNSLSMTSISSKTVTVTNCGGAGTLSFSTSTSNGKSWLHVSSNDSSNQLNVNASKSYTVSVDDFTDTGTITFTITTSNGATSTQQVTVNDTVLIQ